jgi:glycosyltransferase involved in cell wall biosynthesis
MRIAVNTRFLISDRLEGYGYFLYEILKRIVTDHPEHEFIFIFDRPCEQQFIFAANIKPVVIGPPARHPLLWKLWYDIKLPAVLRKHKADVFVSCDGFCSLTTKVPQCIVVHDLAFLHYPAFIPRAQLFFYKRYTPKFLAKASAIATVSEFSRHDISEQYKIDSSAIDVVYSAAKNIFTPITVAEKEEVKNKYTGGTEYFIYTGSIHPRKNLVNLLKAFSIFKKRQKSNWKLLLAGRLAWKHQAFTESLKSYKYRNDVVLTGYLPAEELARLTGAAYAMLYVSLWEGFGVPVLEAMRCGVPVLTSVNSSMQEIAGDAALYADASDYNDIADKMMRLYKDERLRAELIVKGEQAEKKFTWEKTAELMWGMIMKAANRPT